MRSRALVVWLVTLLAPLAPEPAGAADPRGELRVAIPWTPELAESWRLLNDTTWQFKLRRGVLFHDGEPFNAEAVRFTLERVLNPEQKSPNRANIAEVARIDVVDELTVNLVTSRPYAPLLNRLIDFPILPPRYTTEKGNQGQASSSRPSTVTGGACLRSRGSSSGRSRSRSRGRRRCATARWT